MPAKKKLVLTEEELRTLTLLVKRMNHTARREIAALREAQKRGTASRRLKDLLEKDGDLTKKNAEDLRLVLKRGPLTEVESIFTKLIKLGW